MRINRYVALATGLSRRAADELISNGAVLVNNQPAQAGQQINEGDSVTLHGRNLQLLEHTTILLNKPTGYICSRDGQGSKTIYELLPPQYHHLKPVGRLDKDSSGLLLMTNHGEMAHQLTHPSFVKQKVYEITLDKNLPSHHQRTIEQGIELDDGISKLQLKGSDKNWQITMHEGRNRQIRRTFELLGYNIVKLHRTQFGDYELGELASGKYKVLK